MRPLVLLLALLPTAALSNDSCDDLWFTRNLIMDRAGYCFASPLGRALFDNADCTGTSVRLDRQSQATVAAIRAVEADLRCKVDTRRRTIDLDDIWFRRRMVDLPVSTAEASGCAGWTGGSAPLRAGRDPRSPVVGRVRNGDYLRFGHVEAGLQPVNYVLVYGRDWKPFRAAGWLRVRGDTSRCRMWAG